MTTTTRLDDVRLAVPPQLRIVGNDALASLQWSIDEGWRQGEPVSDCLTAFMRLARDDDPQAILRFAERFGVLGVQIDGRPGDPNDSSGLPPTVVENGVTWHVEPLIAWTVYAGHARALLLLAEALRRQVAALGPINAMQVLHDARMLADTEVSLKQLPSEMFGFVVSHSVNGLARKLDSTTEHDLIRQQQLLGNVFSLRWLAESNLTPYMRWDGEAPTLDLDMTTFMGQSGVEGPWSPFALFSVLAAQLAAAFTNAGRYSQCSACGELYIPSGRRARLDRARFCSKECQAAGARRRKRETAARRRERERAAS